MKKNLLALPIIGILGLSIVGCTSKTSDDLSTQRSDLEQMSGETTIFETYNTTFTDENGLYLSQAAVEAKKSSLTTSTTIEDKEEPALTEDHFAIYVDKNYSDSLIKRTISSVKVDNKEYSFNEAFKELNDYIKSVSISSLEYNNYIYTSEKSSILSALYDNTYGIATLKLGDFETNTTTSWAKNVDFSSAYEYYKENTSAEINLEIVYLPVFVKRVYSNREILKSYLFVPVYMTFVTNGSEIYKTSAGKYETKTSTISTVKSVDFEFDSNGSIKSSTKAATTTSTSTSTSDLTSTK